MTPRELIAAFEVVAEAPDGVKRLRELVLQLAVRGKLVPQDPADEPASVLLERIAGERTQLTRSRGGANPESASGIHPDKVPFELPLSWKWSRLGAVGSWGAGATPRRGRSDYYGGPHAWFKSGELSDGPMDGPSAEQVTDLALAECSLRLNRPGDILIAMYGATIGKLGIVTVASTTNQAVCACTCYPGVANRFLFTFLRAWRRNFEEQGAGGAQPNISKEKIVATPIAVPPLPEQHRIVARVDELMGLLDRLEAARRERETTRDAARDSALAALCNADTPEEVELAWNRIAEQMPALFTRPADLEPLRQAVLQLAVRGRLVRQDPADEPARAMITRLSTGATRPVERRARRTGSQAPHAGEAHDVPRIPDAWCWTELGVAADVRDGTHDSPRYVETGVPLVTSKNLSSGVLDLSSAKFICMADHESISKRSAVCPGDILFAMIGSIGNPVLVSTATPFSIKNVALFKPLEDSPLDFDYALIYLKHASTHMRAGAAGGVQQFISLGDLRRYPIPLPPLAEQHRIVGRVDALMSLIDQLEARLTAVEALHAQFAAAAVHHLDA